MTLCIIVDIFINSLNEKQILDMHVNIEQARVLSLVDKKITRIKSNHDKRNINCSKNHK